MRPVGFSKQTHEKRKPKKMQKISESQKALSQFLNRWGKVTTLHMTLRQTIVNEAIPDEKRAPDEAMGELWVRRKPSCIWWKQGHQIQLLTPKALVMLTPKEKKGYWVDYPSVDTIQELSNRAEWNFFMKGEKIEEAYRLLSTEEKKDRFIYLFEALSHQREYQKLELVLRTSKGTKGVKEAIASLSSLISIRFINTDPSQKEFLLFDFLSIDVNPTVVDENIFDYKPKEDDETLTGEKPHAIVRHCRPSQ